MPMNTIRSGIRIGRKARGPATLPGGDSGASPSPTPTLPPQPTPTRPSIKPIDPSGNSPSFSFGFRSEEHTSELQSLTNLVCRLLLEKKNKALLVPCCNGYV